MEEKNLTISFKANKETIDRIESLYLEFKEENSSEYIDSFYRMKGLSVSVYKPNKKGDVNVVFQGDEALKEARLFKPDIEIEDKPLSKAPTSKFPQIGSDEVGTGDLFGPIIVCAAYVKKEDLSFLKELGVADSKLLSDEKIRGIGPSLVKKFDYSLLSLMPEKFNDVVKDNNMNKIKARMHNRALANLSKRHPEAHIYLDQFAFEKTYYSYLSEDDEVVKGINFSTKGELHYPSVALGSVIARYVFLEKMAELSKELGKEIPFGAGSIADDFLKEVLKDKTKEELKKFAKLSFANFKKI